jgi:hypothetical protein
VKKEKNRIEKVVKEKLVKSTHLFFTNMDSRIGLDYIVENADYTTKLGAGKTILRHI